MIVTTDAPRPQRKIYYFIFSNMNILVTGVPEIGKTTLIVRILGVIKLFEMTRDNRDSLVRDISMLLNS